MWPECLPDLCKGRLQPFCACAFVAEQPEMIVEVAIGKLFPPLTLINFAGHMMSSLDFT